MSSKKFLYGLCIFYMVSLLGCPFVFAQTEACIFSDSDIEGVEVIQIGDLQVYTLFTDHLTSEPDEVVEVIERRHEREDTAAYLNQLLEKYQERIVSEQSDAQKITELVKSGKIDWIGVEHIETDTASIDNANDRYLRAQDRINTELNQSSEWSFNKTNQLLFLVFEAYAIARVTHPEDFHRVGIFPLDDEGLKNETTDNINQLQYLIALIKKDAHVTDAQYSAILSFMEDMNIRSLLISESGLESFLDNLGVPGGPTITRLNMRRLIRVNNNIISLISPRDAAVVQSILELPGNGLVLFGRAHGPGIKQGLISACQK